MRPLYGWTCLKSWVSQFVWIFNDLNTGKGMERCCLYLFVVSFCLPKHWLTRILPTLKHDDEELIRKLVKKSIWGWEGVGAGKCHSMSRITVPFKPMRWHALVQTMVRHFSEHASSLVNGTVEASSLAARAHE